MASLTTANFDIEMMRFPHVFGFKLRPHIVTPSPRDVISLVPAG